MEAPLSVNSLVVWLALAAEVPLLLVLRRLNGPAKPSDWF
jgi:hypothetical protein